MRDRLNYTQMTDSQIQSFRAAITSFAKLNSMAESEVFLRVRESVFRMREEVTISVWDDTKTRLDILKNTVVAGIKSMRKALRARGVTDFTETITPDLTNFSFGSVIFGLEIVLTFLNIHTIVEVLNEMVPTDEVPNIRIQGNYQPHED